MSQISKDLLQFSICLKLLPKTSLICIVSRMFQIFSNIIQNIEFDVFSLSKHRLKMASLRIWKHCIVKKSEHCPHLPPISYTESSIYDRCLVGGMNGYNGRVLFFSGSLMLSRGMMLSANNPRESRQTPNISRY